VQGKRDNCNFKARARRTWGLRTQEATCTSCNNAAWAKSVIHLRSVTDSTVKAPCIGRGYASCFTFFFFLQSSEATCWFKNCNYYNNFTGDHIQTELSDLLVRLGRQIGPWFLDLAVILVTCEVLHAHMHCNNGGCLIQHWGYFRPSERRV
jgi:hypothetical protein